ncbi:pyridoxal phosphate-dependent decarboxylase family protein [Amycolatopsis nivea]|uniref:pyridoxal phosphate-dependent decarboxylase family protein n=1 Tax=Amycolatopsis nivea TaxID=1644109 RepID=UPI00106FE52D|nr:aminotransferase class V-fold PLP-dependent enzyme [Amycolatopsis nivea]
MTSEQDRGGVATDAESAAKLLHGVVDQLVEGWRTRPKHPASPVTADAAEIRAWLDKYPLERPEDLEQAVPEVLAALDRWTVHTDHPGYFGLFNPSATWAAVTGDLITAAVNPQLAAWSHAPFAVEAEQRCIDLFSARLGLPATAGGHFTSGGAEANATAVLTALTHAFPQYSTGGLRALDAAPVFYAGADSHLAWLKIAHAAGLGRDACRLVPSDASGRMDVAALEALLAEDRRDGKAPFLVVATAGTTGAGMIDPLPRIADLAHDAGLRFHVDAAWGGAVCLSDRLRGVLTGIERADTITVDAHKWLSVPMGAGMFFTRDRAELNSSFTVSTSYMPGQVDDTADPYTTSNQWSRRFIGLKLWLSLLAYGVSGYGTQIEHDAALGQELRDQLTGAGWLAINDTPLPIVCVTRADAPADPTESWQWHSDLADRVNATGSAWVSPVRVAGRPALRVCVISWRTRTEDIVRLRELLDRV